MGGGELPSGTVTFLFTDIERSTESAAALGDERWAEALETHRDLLRPAFREFNGVEVGTEGDAFFVAFARAGDCVGAAIEGQRALESHIWPGEARLRVRMGLHTGEALVRQNNYVGHNVHKAKRVCDAGHGGQILLSEATAALVGSETKLVDLGPHRLKDLGEPQRLHQLVDAELQRDFPPLRSLDSFTHNLPLVRSTFIGREKDIEQVRSMLKSNRLVTLSAIGGCGKTRLALQVGAELLDEHAGGVFFVDLAPLSDPSLVTHAVASAVGMQLATGIEPAAAAALTPESIAAFLADRTCLVILDNCEHVLDACAEIADVVLGRCPKVKVLATSREVLDVEGEQAWRVPSLSVPEDAAGAQASEAVSLFRSRAVAVRPDFELTPDNIQAVAEICRRLDGIPLAIEFAASRVTHLPPQEIAQRLDDMFKLLTGGRRRAQRQQTMEAVLDWSHELLSGAERVLLRRLSVFAGDFGIDAVEGICVDEDVTPDRVVDVLGSLVAKSLVTTVESRGSARYRLLETVRLYASQKLREADESEMLRARHRDWYERWVSSIPDEKIHFDRSIGEDLAREHPNLRAALEWADASGDMAFVLRLAGRLWVLLFWGGHFDEGTMWLTKAEPEEIEELSPEDRTGALIARGSLALVRRDPDAITLAERAVAASEGEPSFALSRALCELAFNRVVVGQLAQDAALVASARELVAEAMQLADELRSDLNRQSVLRSRGDVELVIGNVAKAYESYEASLALQPHARSLIWATCGTAHQMGKHDRALVLARQYLVQRSDWGTEDSGQTWTSLAMVPAVALAGAGQITEAREILVRLVEESRLSKRPGSIEELMIGFGAVAQITGESARASRLLAWVRSRTVDLGLPLPTQGAYGIYRHYVPLVRAALNAEEAKLGLAEGRAMSEDDVIALALEQAEA